MKETRMIIAGYGGQGVLLLGKIVAEAAMREGRRVTYLPAYGAEVRGGTANCMVCISEEEIGSPAVEEADVLVVLNEPSLARFAARLKKKGMLIVNSSLVKGEMPAGSRVIAGAFTDIAVNLGNARVANMVCLGAFMSGTKLIQPQTVKQILAEFSAKINPQLARTNSDALAAGSNLVKSRDVSQDG
jgi:2-oxoglutarate ferredoxin oxidoreductase subunit gamma